MRRLTTFVAAATICALAASLAWGAPASAAKGKVVQEKVKLKQLKGMQLVFIDAYGKETSAYWMGAKMFKDGRPADPKAYGGEKGLLNKYIIARYYKGEPYNWLYVLMDSASVPVVADMLKGASKATIAKVDPGKTISLKFGAVVKSYPLTGVWAAKDNGGADIVAAKTAEKADEQFSPGDDCYAFRSAKGKLYGIVDDKTYTKFKSDMAIVPGVNTYDPSKAKKPAGN